jgi:hypothetical protein
MSRQASTSDGPHWQAKGVAHDRAVRRKMAIAAPVLIIVAVIIYTLLGR